MSKKVKVKAVKKIMGNDEHEKIGSLFENMLGEGEPDLKIACPKYDRIAKNVKTALTSLSIMAKIEAIEEGEATKIRRFIDTALADEGHLLSCQVDEVMWKVPGLMKEEDKNKFLAAYKELKGSKTVRTFIIICDELAPYRVKLKNEEVGNSWMADVNTMTYCPLPFANTFDIKDFYFSASADEKNRMTALLRKLFNSSYDIYKDLSDPDIDTDELVRVLSSTIDSLKSIPELSRCDKAFKVITESLGTLKNRVGGYYKDFISTKDPTIMLQHFITDVAVENAVGDPEMTQQLRRILAYYKKNASAQKVNDPRISAVFKQMDRQIGKLDDLNLKNIK